MLYREAVYSETADPSAMEILVRAARHGETGSVKACWNGAKQSIIEESDRAYF